MSIQRWDGILGQHPKGTYVLYVDHVQAMAEQGVGLTLPWLKEVSRQREQAIRDCIRAIEAMERLPGGFEAFIHRQSALTALRALLPEGSEE